MKRKHSLLALGMIGLMGGLNSEIAWSSNTSGTMRISGYATAGTNASAPARINTLWVRGFEDNRLNVDRIEISTPSLKDNRTLFRMVRGETFRVWSELKTQLQPSIAARQYAGGSRANKFGDSLDIYVGPNSIQCAKQTYNGTITSISGICLERLVIDLPDSMSGKVTIIVNGYQVHGPKSEEGYQDRENGTDGTMPVSAAAAPASTSSAGRCLAISKIIEHLKAESFDDDKMTVLTRDLKYCAFGSYTGRDIANVVNLFTFGESKATAVGKMLQVTRPMLYSVDDVIVVLLKATFGDDRVDIVKRFAGRVSDPENAGDMAEYFPFDDDQKEAIDAIQSE